MDLELLVTPLLNEISDTAPAGCQSFTSQQLGNPNRERHYLPPSDQPLRKRYRALSGSDLAISSMARRYFSCAELTRNLPALTKIEVVRQPYSSDITTAKAGHVWCAAAISSSPCEAIYPSNTSSSVLAEYPQVANPLLIRDDHAHQSVRQGCHPCQRPISLRISGDRIRSEKILKCFICHCLYQNPHCVVLARLRPPDNHFSRIH